MSSERIQGALTIFRKACELRAEERAAFLDRACGQDAELRAEVESMLAWDDVEEEGQAPHPVRAALSDLAEQATARQAELPQSIAGYRIVRLIAHGGMGDVYEARQEHPARRVAIKVARIGGATGERARRFELEGQLLARLHHPGIAQIIEAGTTSSEQGAQPFFVMEYVEGQTLTDYADENLPSARAKLELMVRVCEAVAFAHSAGVIHRDLKPDNVFIEASGAPRVLDFGVAKVQEAGGFGAATLRTEAGRVLGTMGYMAPEQLAGRAEVGPSADVYSLGVMLYELLTGRLPHDLTAATLTRALAIVTSTDAPLLGVVRPEYRGDIEAVVAKALEKDPRHRYADAGELEADLERHLRGEPTLARPAGPMLKLTKWTRRNPALATAVFGLFLALSSVAAGLVVMNQEALAALEQKNRFLDAKDAKLARADADELWPTRPENAHRIQEWLDRCHELVARLDASRSFLQDMREREGTLAEGAWTFTDPLTQREHDEIEQMVRELQALCDDRALFARIEARLELARSIERITVGDRATDWQAAAERVLENPNYRGFRLEPQVGLVPLGSDPDSGLEEFLHYETHDGEIPVRGDDGKLPIIGQTGIVFVLIPGGTFSMGAPEEDPDQRHNPRVVHASPPHDVEVETFFLSKYEMTQGQWERASGTNPSKFESSVEPVTGVSWTASDDLMRRLGLILPHEEQWEYAARGGEGHKPIWWTGDDIASLEGKENVFDQTTLKWHPDWSTTSGELPAPFEDEKKQRRLAAGDRGPAPVGTYAANAFGLCDIGGNVSEWCSNEPYRYPDVPVDEGGRAVRGSNHRRSAFWARTTARIAMPVAMEFAELGLRPAMAIRR